MASAHPQARVGPRSRGPRAVKATNGRAAAAPAPSTTEGNALYVYGVVRAGAPLQCAVAGMDARWPVRSIEHGDLAAVVSEVPSGVVESTRSNLLAHERVNADVLHEHTLVPMSFGTVFRSGEDVIELLRSAHDAFAGVLEKMRGKVEFGLKVSWDRDAVIEAIGNDDEDVRELREDIAQGAGFGERMRYGQLVDAALERRADVCVAEFLERLRDVCVASRCNDTVGEKMIMNAAFLVERSQEAAFDARLQEIARDHAGLRFQLTGPWAPYNFVAIRLRREGPGEPR